MLMSGLNLSSATTEKSRTTVGRAVVGRIVAAANVMDSATHDVPPAFLQHWTLTSKDVRPKDELLTYLAGAQNWSLSHV